MVTIEEFKKLELRVGTIREARMHPNADRLLILSVEIGPARKQIVAGVARHYTPDRLVGRQVVVVDNLAPAQLRGELSEGMLLAAQDGEGLALIGPEKPVASGAVVR
ncbi:MAG: methionine--tRNA ligase subunit beta [Candidatus Omnitrophica bacterium CG11_big_fil_rev_8_21_14_0_20_64_10]|nr:MAG: methionine--tRNA ligase subunit beta [Candidatus Omnitrophica bacterium CG11_big_fil_rev_8_21_14_0_20_64_10]